MRPGPTSQDAETPNHPGFHPPHLLYNRRGLTRNNSEFRRPKMWALDLTLLTRQCRTVFSKELRHRAYTV
jgi:hypothetical protein